jgi:hypothetical protein
MDVYSYMCQQSIKRFMKSQRVSADFLAAQLGITRATFYAKLAGYRQWKVLELRTLARLGVQVPPMDADLIRRREAVN